MKELCIFSTGAIYVKEGIFNQSGGTLTITDASAESDGGECILLELCWLYQRCFPVAPFLKHILCKGTGTSVNVHSRNLAVPFWLTAPLISPQVFQPAGGETEDMYAPAWASASGSLKRGDADSSKGSTPPWARGDKSTPGGSSKRDEGKPSRSRPASGEVRHSTPDVKKASERSDRGKRVHFSCGCLDSKRGNREPVAGWSPSRGDHPSNSIRGGAG